MAASMEVREKIRRERQVQLDRRRSQSERNRLGQFSTPNELAVDIAEYLVHMMPADEPIRFLEPALGSGSFYSALLETAGADRVLSAVGMEIDRRFADLARELWGEYGLTVLQGDFSELGGEVADANLVLANPPYVRHHHLDPSYKKLLQNRASLASGMSINGLSGLYVYFITLAHSCMAPGALAAWLVPSEFMDVNYGSAVRRYLTDKVELIRIHRFDPGDVQFDDALVSSAVVVFRKEDPPAEATALFTFGGSMSSPVKSESVSVRDLRRSRKWRSRSRPKPSQASGPMLTIGDLFTVRRGLVTGANSFFVMERSEAHRIGIPDDYMKPVLPSPRYLRQGVVRCDEDGFPLLTPQLVLLDCDLPEEQVQSQHPRLAEYLQTGISQGIGDRFLLSRRTPWYRQERREPTPYLSTYMGRGEGDDKPFRFIWNQSKAVATNVYLLLYPKPVLARFTGASEEQAGIVHQALNSLGGPELRAEGRVYGGGLHKLEPGELARLPAAPILKALPELRDVAQPESPGLSSDGQLSFAAMRR